MQAPQARRRVGRNATRAMHMDLPPGLSGAHAAVFIVPPGVPLPRGPRGHSLVLDQGSGACLGWGCRATGD